MSNLDDIIKNTVRGLEETRQVIKQKPLGGSILQTPASGFPLLVECPTHGKMLTSISTITWKKPDGRRVYHCLKCWHEHQTKQMIIDAQKYTKECKVLSDAGRTDTVLRPSMNADLRMKK